MNDSETLDDFLSSDSQQASQPNEKPEGTVSLEDEFAKLLNDFINQDKKITEEKSNKNSLDAFITEPQIADKSATISPLDKSSSESLDSLLTDIKVTPAESINKDNESEYAVSNLKQEEQELARAVSNFHEAVYAMSDKKNIKMPTTDYSEDMLFPNYKPSAGKKIAQYLLDCWDVINKYDPENMKRLSKDADDEAYLTFAESLTDTDMQLAIISYVEIIINIEICEVSYEQKKENAQKNRIKRELYEEYMELQERKAKFIKKLKDKNFPIDVDKLINNYFRIAQKDAVGAFEALTKNPAMFSPIEIDKIKPKFFGLIKVVPEDGIKANQKIGNFIKKLKV